MHGCTGFASRSSTVPGFNAHPYGLFLPDDFYPQSLPSRLQPHLAKSCQCTNFLLHALPSVSADCQCTLLSPVSSVRIVRAMLTIHLAWLNLTGPYMSRHLRQIEHPKLHPLLTLPPADAHIAQLLHAFGAAPGALQRPYTEATSTGYQTKLSLRIHRSSEQRIA